jgi:hypothetical protein
MPDPSSAQHFDYVGNAEPSRGVLGERMALPCCDLVALDAVRSGMESAHVADEAPGDLGR